MNNKVKIQDATAIVVINHNDKLPIADDSGIPKSITIGQIIDVVKEYVDGGSGTSDYKKLSNKPQINNVELDGNKTLEELSIQEKLRSGVNIATINNQDITKGGNINIEGGDEGGGITPDRPTTETSMGYKILKADKTVEDFNFEDIFSQMLIDQVYITKAPIGSISPVRLTPEKGFNCINLEVKEGDKYFIKGDGDTGATLYCFADASNRVLELSEDYTETAGIYLTAPKNAVKLIVNFRITTRKTSQIYKITYNTRVTKFKLEQSDFLDENTIYEVQYDFSLDGINLKMPKNCIIHFNGGLLRNGSIIGSNTSIEGDVVQIFDKISLNGNFNVNIIPVEWFGAESVYYKSRITNERVQYTSANLPKEVFTIKDSSDSFIKALELSSLSGGEAECQSRIYRIDHEVYVPIRSVLHTQNDTNIVAKMEGLGTKKIIQDYDTVEFSIEESETPYTTINANEFFTTDNMAVAFRVAPIRTKIYGGGTLILNHARYTIGLLFESEMYCYMDTTYNSPVIDLCVVGENRGCTCHDKPDGDFNFEGHGFPDPSLGNTSTKNMVYYWDIDSKKLYHKGKRGEDSWGVWEEMSLLADAHWNTCVRFQVLNAWDGGRIFNPLINIKCIWGARGIEMYIEPKNGDAENWFNEAFIGGSVSEMYSNYLSVFCAKECSCGNQDWSKLLCQASRNGMYNSSMFFAIRAGNILLGHFWDVSQLRPRQHYNYYLGVQTNYIRFTWTDGSVKDLGKGNVYEGSTRSIADFANSFKYKNLLKYRDLWNAGINNVNWNHFCIFDAPIRNTVDFKVDGIPDMDIVDFILAPGLTKGEVRSNVDEYASKYNKTPFVNILTKYDNFEELYKDYVVTTQESESNIINDITDRLLNGKNYTINHNKVPNLLFDEQYTTSKEVVNTDTGKYGFALNLLGASVQSLHTWRRDHAFLVLEFQNNKYLDGYSKYLKVAYINKNKFLFEEPAIKPLVRTGGGDANPMNNVIIELPIISEMNDIVCIYTTTKIPGFKVTLYNIKYYTSTLNRIKDVNTGSLDNIPPCPPTGHLYYDTNNKETLQNVGDSTTPKWVKLGGESKPNGILEVNHGTSDTTYTLPPNEFHIWGRITRLNITLGNTNSDRVNEYMFQFSCGPEATTLILPSNIKWIGTVPKFESDKTYQVSIINNLAISGGA